MAAILEKVRDHQKHPVLTKEERIAQFGTYTPTRRRANLPTSQCSSIHQQSVVSLPAAPNRSRGNEETLSEADDFTTVEEADPITTSGKIHAGRKHSIIVSQSPRREHRFPWLKAGAFLFLALIVWVIMQMVFAIINFATDVSNTYNYGPTRTTVVSAVFGHNDSQSNQTQIIAVNLHGALLIQEVPGGDISKIQTYPTGMMLVGDVAAKTPIILTVKDLNGDHKLDMLIQLPGQSVTIKMLNTGTTFTLAK